MTLAGREPLRLHVVRHGETEWSLTGRHTGRTDLPLTIHGQRQAGGLAAYFRSIPPSRVLTSPRARARQTCEGAGLADHAAIDRDLAEWDYGEYEGRRSIDIHIERPGWDVFRDGSPADETPADVAARADRLIARLTALAATSRSSRTASSAVRSPRAGSDCPWQQGVTSHSTPRRWVFSDSRRTVAMPR